jgi:hypothetical protein
VISEEELTEYVDLLKFVLMKRTRKNFEEFMLVKLNGKDEVVIKT